MEVDNKIGIIYCWRNTQNEKRYIGQTIDPKRRYREHKRHLGHYDGQNLFGRALNKYSSMSDWEYTVIEEVPKDMLDEREIYWIAFYNSFNQGYNMSKGGMRHDGYEMSAETRRKLSMAHKGKKRPAKTCKKISEALKGITRSEETRKKLSEVNKGRKHTPETLKKLSEASKGRKHTPEARKKISEAHKGRKHTSEALKNMSNAHNPNKIGVFQNDMLIAVCDTLKEAACLTDVSHTCVQQIASGKRSKTKSGYSFKYISKSS